VFKQYKDLDFEAFSGLVRSFFGYDENDWSGAWPARENDDETSFAKRLITGLAAEHYFESVQPGLPEFSGYVLENTTRLGCGYDFRLRSDANKDFLAVEVKGLKQRMGALVFTPKEYEVAAALNNRFFLFVVKDFGRTPFHEIYQDPLACDLQFRRKERVIVHVSWQASV
jgi:hypothetical protein